VRFALWTQLIYRLRLFNDEHRRLIGVIITKRDNAQRSATERNLVA
jgi:hypothetical protein